ncbi:MAG: selenide, water dikinase SelD, partial [Tranquillimonas sp.]
LPGARLTLIDPGPVTAYTGMLPGHIAGHYSRAALEIDLVRLARFAGARLVMGRADALDPADRRVHVAGRGWIDFDVCSIDIGIHGRLPELPGFAEHGVAAKPLDDFADAWARHLDALRANPALAHSGAAVIGGGVAGAELAMAVAHGGARAAGRKPAVTLIERSRALAGLAPGADRALRRALAAAGIALVEHRQVTHIAADGVQLDDGRHIPSAFTVGAAGARPWGWLAQTGLALHEGYVAVDAHLASTSHPGIFAAGDCAYLTHAPRPKAGVFAVRAAPVLFANLRAALSGDRPRRFRPQRQYLKLVSLGDTAAVAERGRLSAGGSGPVGRALWQLKDRIDRRFMARLGDFRAMPAPRLPAQVAAGLSDEIGTGAPPCGGCGAKVGQGALSRALSDLARRRDDIETGAGDDAAVLRIGGARQVITVDHLRAVTEDPRAMARIAALHALGDVWAMGARPQAALPSLTLPRLSPRLQARTLAEIMEAAQQVFAAAGAEIVGGHTATGAELSIGFTVTGLLDRPAITLSGARPGDRLILTKPIGSGTVMAGEMALAAAGRDVARALDLMQQDQGAAARILGAAHAMTDVTGFGLAGHLLGLLDASGLGAEIDLAAVPLMPGAADLARRGIRSTLFPANAEAAARMTLPGRPEAALLFDPQTAGGLLAALAPPAAADALDRLRAAGYQAALIGTLSDGPPLLRVT